MWPNQILAFTLLNGLALTFMLTSHRMHGWKRTYLGCIAMFSCRPAHVFTLLSPQDLQVLAR